VSQLDVYCGLSVLNHKPSVRLVSTPARRQGKTWAMSKLRDAIRNGTMKSAWDGIEDPFDAPTTYAQVDEQWERDRRAKLEEANRRQDEMNARLAAERHERAQHELEDIEGFGTF